MPNPSSMLLSTVPATLTRGDRSRPQLTQTSAFPATAFKQRR
ncbi:hypothetical protein F441_06349 [Phytophthora nicotianae CJ01A1]|uniref:Uncharacterized protein n=6 Tax=Phytophthora nicotianae TaxID=4792 RepID=W2RBC5_PHYN3|nr:hypothetical protein PPTG_20937 [Phytophthora nicotianae INRA-310]ETI50022.1 hypothetical protein F443_06342 [Phytophthora nicotianae P1569]ETL43302.1 hypothetical protein L916_06160 [Phytophthora nicotianae]ETO78734.1 hypothetical protein F444_06405 [Phytophthora nicotianae P1976]ETP19782.1 hypothetical protein F441_06349 [Phytophthora nicotianae CJ01A1]ETP47724.1 hypothetical protein F442_06386 [Phytophthora nicotianae P10297]